MLKKMLQKILKMIEEHTITFLIFKLQDQRDVNIQVYKAKKNPEETVGNLNL